MTPAGQLQPTTAAQPYRHPGVTAVTGWRRCHRLLAVRRRVAEQCRGQQQHGGEEQHATASGSRLLLVLLVPLHGPSRWRSKGTQ